MKAILVTIVAAVSILALAFMVAVAVDERDEALALLAESQTQTAEVITLNEELLVMVDRAITAGEEVMALCRAAKEPTENTP